MKKKLLIIGCVCILAFGFYLVYNAGYDAGRNSSNLDKIYERYLDDIFPNNENEYVQINLRNDSYYVYHNCTQDEYLDWKDMFIDCGGFYWDFTFADFNGYSIWHKSI